MLARCILHVSRSNSCSRFALLPASSISSSPAGYNVMHLTLLNSSYQQFYAAFEEGLNETSSQHICLRDALKVECCLSGALHNSEKQRNIRKGRILPIHLPLCNFREVILKPEEDKCLLLWWILCRLWAFWRCGVKLMNSWLRVMELRTITVSWAKQTRCWRICHLQLACGFRQGERHFRMRYILASVVLPPHFLYE